MPGAWQPTSVDSRPTGVTPNDTSSTAARSSATFAALLANWRTNVADWPYNTGQWKRLRLMKLSVEPMCEPCETAGRIEAANTVDHRVPISAGGAAFPGLDGLASMCARCHSAKTARGVEAGAVRTKRALQPRKGCDADGNPLDPAHPWHAAKSLRAAPEKTDMGPNAQLVVGGDDWSDDNDG